MDGSSILTSVKKSLGITEEYTHFDPDLILHINSALSILSQLGVGPEGGYMIEDTTQTWVDFMGADPRLNLVKSYVSQKVRLLFDPPLGAAVIEAMNKSLGELEWRITVATDDETIGKDSLSSEDLSDDEVDDIIGSIGTNRNEDDYDYNLDADDLSDSEINDILSVIGSEKNK